MRAFTRTFAARALLVVLALAFAIWGVNDFLGGVGRNELARIGDRAVTPQMLDRDFRNWLENQRNSEEPVTRTQALEQNVPARLLDAMVGRIALQQYVERLGIHVSDELVAARIREVPAARNPINNSFDQGQYMQFLQAIGYTPGEFEREVRADLSVEQLIRSLVGGVRAPRSVAALGLAFESERRVITVAEAPVSRIGAIPPPTEAQLQAFYNEMRPNLRVPEYRALTLVYARASDFTSRVDVPETRIAEEFEARRAALGQPERRTIVQISAQNEAQARDAAARLSRGEEPAAIASALGVQTVTHAERAQTDIPDRAIATAAFSAQLNAVSTVRGTLAPWAAIRVTAIEPAVTPTLADHRDEIRNAIAEEEAVDLMNEAVAAFNDSRAEGAAFAQAARANGLTVVVVPAVNDQGRTPAGENAEAFVDQPELLRAAFSAPEGEATDFVPAADGADVLINVDRVTPATTRPFAEVRESLVGIWTQRQRLERVQAMGRRVAEAVVAGRTFQQAAAAEGGAIVVRSQPIDRQTAAQQIPARQLGSAIFGAHEGEVVFDVRLDGQSLMIAHVEAIQRADPAAPENAEAVERWRNEMRQSIQLSLSQAVEAAVRERARVRRNDALLRQTYGGADGAGEDEAQ
ncbi:MAG: SurA N-terminal domain-containing protein [Hyphomonadaceae bacterium]